MALKAWTVVGVVNVDGMRTALGKLKTFKSAGRAAAKVWQRAWGLAKSAMVAWTAAMGAATAATVGFAAKTERQFSELAKLTSDTIGSEIGRAVQQMGERLPVARDQLFETAEAALRLGVRGTQNVREFTRVMAKVGVATDIAAGDAAEIMARFAAATGTPISKVRNLASVVNELSNTLPRSFSQILQSAQRAGPQLARLGASATDISTLSGVLTSVSASAQRAGTRLRRLGQELTEPDKIQGVTKGFEKLGVDGFESIIRNNPTKAIVMMARAMRRGNVAATAITETLATSSRQALAGLSQRLPRLVEELDKMNKEFERGTSLQEEFVQFQDDLVSQWETLKTKLINVAAGIGENLLPAFKDLVFFIQNNAANIGAVVGKGMGQTLDVMISIIEAVKGHVKAIGIGGLIGFLFMGPQGAAIGGLIGKIISENAARLKRLANNIPFVQFDVNPITQSRMEFQEIDRKARGIQKTIRQIQKEGLGSLGFGKRFDILTEGRLANAFFQAQQENDPQILIDALSKKALKLREQAQQVQANLENMLDSGIKDPAEEAQGPLDKLLQKLRAIASELKGLGAGDVSRFTGETGLTREGVTFTGKYRRGAARLAELLAIGERPQIPRLGQEGPMADTRLRRAMGIGRAGQAKGYNTIPRQFRPGIPRPGRRPYAPPAMSTSQRMERGFRIGGQVRQAGLGDDAGSDAIGAAIEQGMMVDQQKFTDHVLGVIDEGADEAGQRGAQLFRQLGQQLMAGLASGTFDAEDFLKRAFMQVIQLALFSQSGGLTAALGIASPAKATMPIGQSLVEGIAEGVKSQQSSLQRTMRGVKSTALGEMDGIGREATKRVRGIRGGAPRLPSGENGSLVNIEIPTEDMPEAENPLEEKYQQKTRVWLEEKARQLREDGVPEFQPPQ